MSFMNPVDMVEEDAADLQFPKDEFPDCKATVKSGRKVLKAQPNVNTRYATVYYNAARLNEVLEQQSIKAERNESSTHTHNLSNCVTCRNVLSEPYIKCPDCQELLCLQCFARGSETERHRNNHAYIIVRDDIQVFPGSSGWTAREERVLLRTLQTQGYGNWEAVAKAVQYRHSANECRQHYHDCYFGGIFERLLGLKHASQMYVPERMPYIVRMRSVDPPRHDDISSMQFKLMAGYRCARGDFDTPYDVSAESILTTVLECDDMLEGANGDLEQLDDTQIVIEELKCGLVRAYNHRLRERHRRYKIMRDNGLIMTNRSMGWIAKYADALRSESNCKRFLAFMQLCNPIKFDLLVEGLKYFADLQRTIFRLYELRQNGVRTISGGALYFKLKKKRLVEQRERLKSERYRYLQDWRKLIPSTNSGSQMDPFIMARTAVTMPRRKAGPIDVFGLPGFAKLSEDERNLCSVARIVPQSYIDYKNILIAENTKVGHLRLADARRLIKIDVNKTRQIYDFLIEHGHINKPN